MKEKRFSPLWHQSEVNMRTVANIAYDQGILIGRGQNSVGVFLCVDEQFGGKCAVKVIEKSKVSDPTNLWAEAKAMYEARHDNVVPVQYGCEKDDKIMLAMPYFSRGSLADRIKTGPLSLLESLRVCDSVLSGLHQIHAANHVHWDLKPSNVLFDDNDVAKVSDFGQARPLDPLGMAMPPSLIYDAAMPPEVLLGRPGTPISDVFQAGLTMYRVVNGDPFFNFQFHAAGAELAKMIVDGEFPDRDNYMPHVSRSLRGIINKALEVDPTQRYGTALAFQAALARSRPQHDWQIACSASGEIEWRSPRNPSPDLVVRRAVDGKKWKVAIHTERTGEKPRAAMKQLWKDGLTERQSFPYLRKIFSELQ
jgi:serine/threonine protein kinase